jgi:hypothetical protein
VKLSEPRAARKRGSGGAGGRSRTLRKKRTGVSRRHHRWLKKHRPYTSRWGAGRRCPIREGPQCRGRGEAVGDYIFTAEPSRRPPQIVYATGGTGSGLPPRRTNAGPVRRGAFEKDYNPARHSQAEWEPTSQWPRAASWRWSFLPRDRTGDNRGRLGTGGS